MYLKAYYFDSTSLEKEVVERDMFSSMYSLIITNLHTIAWNSEVCSILLIMKVSLTYAVVSSKEFFVIIYTFLSFNVIFINTSQFH